MMHKQSIATTPDVWQERDYRDRHGTDYTHWSIYRNVSPNDAGICLAMVGLIWRSCDQENWHAAVYWLADLNNPSHCPANQKCPALFTEIQDAMQWCDRQIRLGHPLHRQTIIHATHN